MFRFLFGALAACFLALGAASAASLPQRTVRQCADIGLYDLRSLPAVARQMYTYRTHADVVVIDLSATACVRDPLKVVVGVTDAFDTDREQFFLSQIFSDAFVAAYEVVFLALTVRRPTEDAVFVYVAVPRNEVTMLRGR
ncbi:MAG: hypothetical protein HYS74_01260 [Parcubacteria group bacterium]|nr:hypothetical protein [Parcubacteria group bacterium]